MALLTLGLPVMKSSQAEHKDILQCTHLICVILQIISSDKIYPNTYERYSCGKNEREERKIFCCTIFIKCIYKYPKVFAILNWISDLADVIMEENKTERRYFYDKGKCDGRCLPDSGGQDH